MTYCSKQGQFASLGLYKSVASTELNCSPLKQCVPTSFSFYFCYGTTKVKRIHTNLMACLDFHWNSKWIFSAWLINWFKSTLCMSGVWDGAIASILETATEKSYSICCWMTPYSSVETWYSGGFIPFPNLSIRLVLFTSLWLLSRYLFYVQVIHSLSKCPQSAVVLFTKTKKYLQVFENMIFIILWETIQGQNSAE